MISQLMGSTQQQVGVVLTVPVKYDWHYDKEVVRHIKSRCTVIGVH